MSGTPEFWARTLRSNALSEQVLPVDVERIVEWCPVHFAEVPLDGFLGLCMRVGKTCGILIKSDQPHGQRRFTIAHELGHFAIPAHAKVGESGHQCLEASVVSGESSTHTEREANAFAAELLMPRAEFVTMARHKGASIRVAKELAGRERFDVSITACAIRMVELSGRSLALLCYERGRLAWQVRSQSFRYFLPVRGSQPPFGSAARDAVLNGVGCDEPVEVTDAGWLAEAWDCEELLESTLCMPALDQVLCLLDAVRA